MTLKQKEEASVTAKEWNDTHPPAEIQAKATEEKGRKYVQEFAKEMWKQCGARVVVMVAWKGATGDVMYGLHDFNDELGDGKVFDGWDTVETKWEQYAHGVFGVEDSGEGTEDEAAVPRRKATKGQWHPKINLPTLENGMPSISIILNMNLQEKKDVVRAFIVFIMGRLVAAAIFLCLGPQLHLTTVNTYLATIGPQMLDSRNP
ncbi:hypothetical protein SCLCIDRAFT_20824 [Scleroderma citrinum Foug A]|uniref:Uncharacterized protein n=1 Tax=Scleroderma citrinum Foug A TaxID=1036808 RepID=A0A0C3EHS3_9AGAM|nr:hypothetical protein SCLCIDRAFT_20824 [Scleroderma citrinum Foug A]